MEWIPVLVIAVLALVIIEGLTMYLYQEDVQRIFQVIARRFSQADVLVETMNPMVVKRFREKSRHPLSPPRFHR